jgi:hypothetical protein
MIPDLFYAEPKPEPHYEKIMQLRNTNYTPKVSFIVKSQLFYVHSVMEILIDRTMKLASACMESQSTKMV